jgi:uncharacterized membrane-anchored protein YitT (DUF2179 family)
LPVWARRGAGLASPTPNDLKETSVTEVAPTIRHRWHEDAFAMITGVLLVSLGVTLHKQTSILTGGTAGLSLLLTYARGWDFATTFFLVNVPFYLLAVLRLGWKLTIQTLIGVTLVSLLVRQTGQWITISAIQPVYAAITGGLLIGVGLLILFRHRISLGGVNILAIYLQERFGWSAGIVQFCFDAAVLAAAYFVVGGDKVLLSLLAAVSLNVVLALNHRSGRYMGSS